MIAATHNSAQATVPPLLAIAAAVLLAGCGRTAPGKVVVEGSVTFNGAPVENGEIRFYPAEGTEGPVSGAPIVNGKYEAKSKGGVPVGEHIVQIRAYRPPRASGAASPDSLGAPEQYLPEKYNSKSTLRQSISPDADPATCDFNLTT